MKATNENGYMMDNHYQVYAPLCAKTKLEAKANNSEVKVEISPIVEGRATVTATYKGQKKIFMIN